jgi:hypothetical protein
MLGLYLACFLFGAVLIGAALFGGGSEHHLDKDASLDKDLHSGGDHDTAHEAGEAARALPWLPFLSLRFWTFGAASFGLTGLLLTLLPIASWVTLLLAVAVGLGVGSGAAALFRAINKDEVTGSVSLARYAGEEARVIVAVRPGATGRIALESAAGRVEIPAITRDAEVLLAGERVIVAGVSDGVADVSRLRPAPRESAAGRESS